ncbi:MAG TPA: MarR family transcriptional regulator [Rugosimonospora sp.]|nr:MarR family transcriptional regulator [Rugosimonospora sp.]
MTVARPTGHELDAPPWSRVEGTLMSTARAVRRAYDAALAELGVNLSEASVLAHLKDAGALTQTELARRIGTGRARMGAWIDSLAAKGLVERQADPSDRRVWNVALTIAGERLWEQTAAVDRCIRKVLRAGSTPDDRARLDALLTLINRNADALVSTSADTVGRGKSPSD